MKKLTFSFDIGYASIGWAVLKDEPFPQVAGTGVVLFPPNECLASKRRAYRRMRRTIRSRRQRIDRIGKILESHGVISADERRMPGHAAPFLLASRALSGQISLSGKEVWDLMRWYAHNRGYDGNQHWSSNQEEDSQEDIRRVETARAFMDKYGTHTMAETIVHMLKLDVTGNNATTENYKHAAMAFPRDLVENEVKSILAASELPAEVAALIVEPADRHRDELAACGVLLPKRYCGSVLFGQLLPRFDNRIIARCPLTWTKEYAVAKQNGASDKIAKARADKYAKVPKADCREFYEYRFARILANIRVAGAPLSSEHRKILMKQGIEKGKYTATSFRKAVAALVGNVETNLKNYFELHPNSEQALVLVPKDKKQQTSGRAPYARPVLIQAVEEVLRGEDPTRPARSVAHLDGEPKAQDGVLYPLSDPLSETNHMLRQRRVEDLSNNHLVRHRMLIFERLLRDMIHVYADGDPRQVGRFCIEVARELKEYSGLTIKEIAAKENEKMKHFHAAVKKLHTDAPDMPLSAKLIRKCRIAMDLNWHCPFTDKVYSVRDLPKLEMEHVVPFASRRSNALASLVLTWPEVNRKKGKRTGMQFVTECAGEYIDSIHADIVTPEKYKKFVEKLDTLGSKDDQRRKKTRKGLMLVGSCSERKDDINEDFTEGMLTQSSQLMKIAAHVARRACPQAQVAIIPGSVTAMVRASWKAMGALAKAAPEIVNPETTNLREKEEIRGITHLHHALDACVLGLIPLLIPAGTNGIIWQALGMRNLSDKQVQQLRELRLGNNLRIERNESKSRLRLQALPQDTFRSISLTLCEKRVVQHVPADMGGAKLEENMRKLQLIDGEYWYNGKCANPGALLGLRPQGESKLAKCKSYLRVNDNFGLVIWLDSNTGKPLLSPSPVLVPHHCVYKRLCALRKEYGKQPFILLRKGQLVRTWGQKNEMRNRIWRIEGIAKSNNNILVTLCSPQYVKLDNKSSLKWIATHNSLLKGAAGIEILPDLYTGCPTE